MVAGEGVLGLISELNEEDLVVGDSDAEDYTASTDSNLSSCSESAGMVCIGVVDKFGVPRV